MEKEGDGKWRNCFLCSYKKGRFKAPKKQNISASNSVISLFLTI